MGLQYNPNSTKHYRLLLVDVFKYKGLRLRNFTRNGNQIAPFKLLVNDRCPTLISGFERVIEWTLDKEGEFQMQLLQST